MGDIRKSDTGYTGAAQHASFKLRRGLYKTTQRTLAEEAQRKIDARKAKKDPPSHLYECKSCKSQYSPEFVAEALAIVEAGWSVASTARLMGVNYATLLNWTTGVNRGGESASSLKEKSK